MSNFHALVAGFHNFREEYLLKEREFFEALKHGQDPHTLVIACCDSRVDPAIIMGCRPGEVFVIRSVAALVPPADRVGARDAVISAVEYGVKHLEVSSIVVMGHSNCEGIHAALNPEKVASEAHILRWVQLANPVIEELAREGALPDAAEGEPALDPAAFVERCEKAAVLLSIENLLSYDWLRERVLASTLGLHALYYDMHAASLNIWDAVRERFVPTHEIARPKASAGGGAQEGAR